MKKRILSIMLCLCMVALMPTAALATTTVTKVTVDQLELPRVGATPDTTAVAVERNNRQLSPYVYVDKVEWEGELDENGCFKVGVSYKVTVTVKTQNGARFGNAFEKGQRTEATLIVGPRHSPDATTIDTDKCYWCYTKSVSSKELVYHFYFSPLASSGLTELDEVNNVLDTIYDARDSFSPSRSVTREDVLAWGESLIPEGYSVKLSLRNFNKDEYAHADEIMNLTIAFVAECGSTKVIGKGISKRILPEESAVGEDAVKLAEDYQAIRLAFSRGDITNVTNEADLYELARGAITHGTQIEITYFAMDKADYAQKGRITVKATLTLGSESRNLDQDVNIPMMVRTLPEGISLTSEEWDAICYTNRSRIQQGQYPVFAVDFMQNVADLRASDLTLSYSHTRPDGRDPFTAFDDLGYSHGSAAENIGKNIGAEGLVANWMGSEGHRKNLLTSNWTYIGMGYEYNYSEQCDYWVQIFTTGGHVVSWKTGLNKTTYADSFELEQDYLILTMSDGRTAYMPLDLEVMERTATGYKIALDSNTTAEFTVLRIDKGDAKTDFYDVPAGSYYENAVVWALEKNVTNGTGDGGFSPDTTCTRAQVVTFLWRSKGEPEPTTKTNPFQDISESDWYYKSVLWAVEESITNGTSATTFSPNVTCTTAQILTFLYRAMGQPQVSSTNRFYKAFQGNYYAEPLAWADSLKMIDGPASLFDPNTDCTRADTVYFLYKGSAEEQETPKDDSSDDSAVGSYIDWSWSNWTSDESEW